MRKGLFHDRSAKNADCSWYEAFSPQSAFYTWLHVLYPVHNALSSFYTSVRSPQSVSHVLNWQKPTIAHALYWPKTYDSGSCKSTQTLPVPSVCETTCFYHLKQRQLFGLRTGLESLLALGKQLLIIFSSETMKRRTCWCKFPARRDSFSGISWRYYYICQLFDLYFNTVMNKG